MPKEVKVTRNLARKLAPRVKFMQWEEARDVLDLATDGELNAFQLDLLTDMTLGWTV
jgi:hypothetical protein